MLCEPIPFWERLLIIDNRGFPLYSDKDDVFNNESNGLLIGGLFIGIETLFTSEFDDELRELKGVKYHASVLKLQVKSSNILFIGLKGAEICEKKRRKELDFVANQFNQKIRNDIHDPYFFNEFRNSPKTRKLVLIAVK